MSNISLFLSAILFWQSTEGKRGGINPSDQVQRFPFHNVGSWFYSVTPPLLCRPICSTWQRPPDQRQKHEIQQLGWGGGGGSLSLPPATSQSFLRTSCSKFVPANNSDLKMLWHDNSPENDNLFALYNTFRYQRNYSKYSRL